MRSSKQNKLRTEQLRSIEYDLPDFVMQLCLLLEAGLVFDSAFMKLCELFGSNDSYLYANCRLIVERASASNASIAGELYAFARSTGVRSFIRLATIISESLKRGSELSSKLESERRFLLSQRLNAAKSKAREAETRLSFPLAMLLLSLVLISAAPALMQLSC